MRLLLLGTGGYHPNERRHTACILVPEFGMMLDAGTAAFRVQEHLEGNELNVFLTHPHVDHIVGLTYLLGLTHNGEPVRVAAHANQATLDAVRDSLLAQELFPVSPIERLEVLPAQTKLSDGVSMRTFPLDHPGGSLGIRIDHRGKSFAYVTDTKPLTAPQLEEIRGVDLLIHEAYYDESHREMADLTGHSTALDAARAAHACGAKRLILVHPDPRCTDNQPALEEAQAAFPHAEFGRDLQEVTL